MYERDDQEAYRSEESIDSSDERLSSQYSSESVPDFVSDDGIFCIEKCKIPSLHLTEKCDNRLAFDHEYIGEDEPNEELGQDDSRIAEVSESGLSDGFEILSIDHITDHLTQTEIDMEALLDPIDKSLELSSNLRGPIDELSHLTDNLRNDRDK